MKLVLKIALITLISYKTYALNCNSFWAIGFPDPSRIHDTINCEQGVTSTPFGTEIYYTTELLANPQLTNKLNVVAESLSLSYSIYNALGDMPRIKVIFYDRPYFGDTATDTTYAFAFINFFRPEVETCPVLVYPSAFSFDEEKLKQLIAHEVFHCFQITNFREQTLWGIRHEENSWWLEGSAQFFSNLVYPNADLEYDPMFGHYDAIEAITAQPRVYSTSVFFQSFYNSNGRNGRAILEFYNHMPTTTGLSQESAFNSVANMSDFFHKFARKIYLRDIIDSNGRIAPTLRVSPNPVSLSLDEVQEVELINKSFSILPYRVNFPRKGNYHLEIRGSNLSRYKISFKRSDTPPNEEWLEFPHTIKIGCSANEDYDIIITRLGESVDNDSVTLYAQREERDDCGCKISSRPTHSCLFGEWQLDHSSLRAFYERMFSTIPNMFFDESLGDFRVSFSNDGTVLWILDGLTVKSHMITESRRRRITTYFEQLYSGVNRNLYTNIGRSRMCAQDVESHVSCIMTITSEMGSSTKPCMTPMFGGSREFTYECNRDTLIYRTAVGANPDGSDLTFNYIFNRVR